MICSCCGMLYLWVVVPQFVIHQCHSLSLWFVTPHSLFVVVVVHHSSHTCYLSPIHSSSIPDSSSISHVLSIPDSSSVPTHCLLWVGGAMWHGSRGCQVYHVRTEPVAALQAEACRGGMGNRLHTWGTNSIYS